MDGTLPLASTLLCLIGSLIFISLIILVNTTHIVREDTRLSVYRLGRYLGDKGPGLVLLIPVIDRGILKRLGEVEKTPDTRLVGVVGETRTTVYTDGKVFLAGEEWNAMSQTFIPAGQRVRVVRMIVEVEKE
jgi:membrane-bound ClpP family serine protease